MIRNGILGRQFADLAVYLVLPWLCLLMPRSWGERLLHACARGGWVLSARSGSACDAAATIIHIEDRAEWRRRWRLLELIEARDLWFCLCGRSSVLLSRTQVEGTLPTAGDHKLLLGLHWGTSVLALVYFQRAGWAPRLVYRRVMPELRRQAPFQYLYLRAMVRFIKRVCGQRAIAVPGGKSEVDRALGAGDTLVLLLDAPVTGEPLTRDVRLLGRPARLYANGFDLVCRSGSPCVLFAMGLQAGEGADRCLSFETPERHDDPARLADAVAAHFDRCMARDSAQWRLWHVASHLFLPEVEGVD